MFRSPAAVASATVLASLAIADSANAADYVSTTFQERGEHEFVVPDGVSSLRVRAIGEQGGAGTRSDGSLLGGGWGGVVTGTVAVKAKRAYWVEVGVGGGPAGSARYPGGRGGGASAFRVCHRTDPGCDDFNGTERSRVIVAGGGGGSAGGHPNTYGRGGNAGGQGGASEIAPFEPTLTTGGNPGTETAGGGAGLGLFGVGQDGAMGLGGSGGGGVNAYAGGGGGGGGWYGGGGGGVSSYQRPIGGGGGGGGSNHTHWRVVSPEIRTATTGKPSVTLTWLDDVPPRPTIGTTDGAVVGPRPTLHGKSGTEMGDRPDVVLAIYAGSNPNDGTPPVQSLTAKQETNGDWSAQPAALAPGTYTAVVTQRDWAHNIGTNLVSFRVAAPTPAPAPQSAPQQPAAPAGPAAPATRPQPQAALPAPAIRIDTKRARLTRGTLSVRLTCTGPIGQRCSGRLALTRKAGKRTITLGSAPYTVTAGRSRTVRVQIRAATLPRRVTAKAAMTARTITVA